MAITLLRPSAFGFQQGIRTEPWSQNLGSGINQTPNAGISVNPLFNSVPQAAGPVATMSRPAFGMPGLQPVNAQPQQVAPAPVAPVMPQIPTYLPAQQGVQQETPPFKQNTINAFGAQPGGLLQQAGLGVNPAAVQGMATTYGQDRAISPYAYMPQSQQQMLTSLSQLGNLTTGQMNPNANVTMPTAQNTQQQALLSALQQQQGSAAGLGAWQQALGQQPNQQGMAAWQQSLNQGLNPQQFVNTQLTQQSYQRGAQQINDNFDLLKQQKMEQLGNRNIGNTATGAGAYELNKIEQDRQKALANLQTDLSINEGQNAFDQYLQQANLGLQGGQLGLSGVSNLANMGLNQGQLGLAGLGSIANIGMQGGNNMFNQQLSLAQLQNMLATDQLNRQSSVVNMGLSPAINWASQMAGLGNQQNLADAARADQLQQQANQRHDAQGSVLGTVAGLVGQVGGQVLGGMTGGSMLGGLGGLGGMMGGGSGSSPGSIQVGNDMTYYR